MKLKRKKAIQEIRNFSKITLFVLFVTIFLMNSLTLTGYGTEEGTSAVASYQRVATGSDGKDYIVQGPVKNRLYDSQGNLSYGHWDPQLHIRMFTLKETNGTTGIGYCVQWGKDMVDQATYYAEKENPNILPAIVQKNIYDQMVLATTYGYAPGKAPVFSDCNEEDWFVATQVILWEYQQGLRTAADRLNNRDGMAKNYFQKALLGRPAEKYYNYILEKIKNHYRKPAFVTGETRILNYNPETKDYRLTLKDEQWDPQDFDIQAANMEVLQEGNQLTFISKEPLETQSVIFSHKKNGIEGPRFIWNDGKGGQRLLSGHHNDYRFSMEFRSERNGQLEVVKTSEDDNIEGIVFIITGENGFSLRAVTDKEGKCNFDLPPGKYTVEEESPSSYRHVDAQEVTIKEDQRVELSFHNVLKKGQLEILKVDKKTKKALSNCTIEILDKEEKVLFQGTTDEDGRVIFEDLPLGNYFFREKISPKGYQLDDQLHPFEVKEDGEIITVEMENQPIPKHPKVTTTPKTGDPGNLSVLIGIVSISLGILILAFLKLRRN